MTECRDDAMREQLPDLDAGTLAPEVQSRLLAHVAACAACAEELVLIRAVRTARPMPAPVDVQAIVSRLPKPDAVPQGEPGVIPFRGIGRTGMPPSVASAPSRRRRHSVGAWQLAAVLGIMVVGAGSVIIARSGNVDATFTVPDSVSVPSVPSTPSVPMVAERSDTLGLIKVPSPTPIAAEASRATVAVSFGDLGDYTEEELERVLARLEQWDGATSTESMPSASFVPSTAGRALQ